MDYVWKLLSLPEENYIYEKPALHIEWDEASCSQQVFLFNEISNVYAHKASDYIKDYGNIRKIKDQPTETLRIASIDIGGGTTDLMITSYFCERSNVVKPIQEFREGFRIAGDDILFGLIKEVILPSFSEHLKNCGGSSGDMAIANFFKSVNDRQTGTKANFANSVLLPAAIQILNQFELEQTQIARIVISDPMTHNDGIFCDALNDIAVDAGLSSWPASDITISVNKIEFEKCLDNSLLKVTENLATALTNFDCDYILLTGRPTKLTYVRELFEKKLLVSPDRLISLHDYRVGAWYPFRDPLTGKIGDPKSTVVVGALLNSVSSFQMTNYSFKSEELCLKSTANFIGEMESSGQIKDDKVIVDNVRKQNEEEFTFQFNNPIHLGSRQIDDERWSTAPMYRISPPSAGLKNFKLPFSVTLSRLSDSFFEDEDGSQIINETKKEELIITEIVDAEERLAPPQTLRLSFNTLGQVDNYWLESGIFI